MIMIPNIIMHEVAGETPRHLAHSKAWLPRGVSEIIRKVRLNPWKRLAQGSLSVQFA